VKGICFTGKGYTDTKSTQPQLRSRAVWSEMAEAMGMRVDKKVGPLTHYLVASLVDTQKMRDAEARGTSVITYERFQKMYDAAVRAVSAGVTTNGVDLDDPADDGSLGYDPLAGQQAAYEAAQAASRRAERGEAARLKREREDAEARAAAEDEALPGWGMF
jgi:hypothetical protein